MNDMPRRNRDFALYGSTMDIESGIALGRIDMDEVFRIAAEHGRILGAQQFGARIYISGDDPVSNLDWS